MPTKHTTMQIGRDQVENALHGIRFAASLDRPINTEVVINFADLGLSDVQADSWFLNLKESYARWWRYQKKLGLVDTSPIYTLAHANPHGRRHVHWALHIPDALYSDFELAVTKRIKKKIVGDVPNDAVLVRQITNAGTLGKYIFRGVDPAYAVYFHMSYSNEGDVYGRRVCTSNAISRAARKRAGWQRKRFRSRLA